jgi:uncharacterized protein YutE (UPF0331/DUF86 family)
VLTAELAERLRLAAGLRNVLVPAYLEVGPARIWTYLNRLGDLEGFARAVQTYLTGARPAPR